MTNIQNLLYSIYLKSPTNLFDEFLSECEKTSSKPMHNILDLKQQQQFNKKLKGDLFEEFCVLYLKNVKNYDNVWLLKDVPDDILELLSLKRRDMGIDIIVEHNNLFYAVQCKYKHNGKCVSWKTLSTFYALCLRITLFEKYIVMTNCNYVANKTNKTNKDISICLQSFKNISKDDWLKMCNKKGQILDNSSKEISKEELRLLRLNKYCYADV